MRDFSNDVRLGRAQMKKVGDGMSGLGTGATVFDKRASVLEKGVDVPRNTRTRLQNLWAGPQCT